MRRVLVIGCGGAGKSTLARRMAERLNLPVVHLDQHFWQPGWVETPHDEWVEVLKGLLARAAWVMDGSYVRSLDQRLQAADAIVFMDTSRWRCVVRVLGRVLRYRGKTRPDLAKGCPERFDWEFMKWIWSYRKRHRQGIIETVERCADTHETVVLRHPREVEPFLESLRPSNVAL